MLQVVIEENTYPLTGRVDIIGNINEIMGDYRLLTRIICDHFGHDAIMKATAGCALDNISNVEIVIKG